MWDVDEIDRAVKRLCGIGALVPAILAIAATTTLAASPGSYEPTTELPNAPLSFAVNGAASIDREDLVIGIDKVRLTYLLRNLTPGEHTLPMAFALPDIDTLELDGAAVALPAYDSQNPTNFLGFWTMIDGAAVAPDVNARALLLGVIDVTAAVADASLPIYPLAPDMTDRIAQMKPEVRADYVKRGILNGMTDPPSPAWTLRTGFHWSVTLPADRAVTIQHGYRPVLGSDIWSAEIAADLTERYCLPGELVDRLNGRLVAGDPPVVYWMTYEPGLKSHMRGKSAAFNLTIEKPGEKGDVSTCFRNLKKTSPTALEWSATDHMQSDDIHVLFVE